MKLLMFVTVAAISLVSIAHADALPDPVYCGRQFPGGVDIRHSGPMSLFGAYSTKLIFKNRGEVIVQTNEGDNGFLSFNAFTLRNTANYGRFTIGKNFNRECFEKKEKCAITGAEYIEYVRRAAKNSYGKGSQLMRERTALACFRSIVMTTIYRSKASDYSKVAVHALTAQQDSQTAAWMKKLKVQNDDEVQDAAEDGAAALEQIQAATK